MHETKYPDGNFSKIKKISSNWIKKTTLINEFVFDYILKYEKMSNFLPKILKHNFENNVLTIETEHISGKRLDYCDKKTLLKYYGIILNDFIIEMNDFSESLPYIKPLELGDKYYTQHIFFCTDIKPSNFIIDENGRLYFVDIDALNFVDDVGFTLSLYRMSNTFTHLLCDKFHFDSLKTQREKIRWIT